MADTETAKLTIGDKVIDLPVMKPSVGPDVIDIRKLYAQGDVFTYDPRLHLDRVLFVDDHLIIDGDKRRIAVSRLPDRRIGRPNRISWNAATCCCMANCPTRRNWKISRPASPVTPCCMNRCSISSAGFRRDAHPDGHHGGRCWRDVGFLPRFDRYQRPVAARGRVDPHDREKCPRLRLGRSSIRLASLSFIRKNSLDYSGNFLHMCFSVPAEDYVVDPILSRAMDRIMMLHADHEQNASTSTVRLASSSGANPFASIAAGIACLWGPAHGGANQACLEMLQEIGTVDRIPEYIARAKDKDDPFRLMGFGHRVYKNFDPRAKVMKQSADEVLGLLGIENNETLKVAKELERIALEDPYFVDKKLYPNVDFYSGIILEAMGFPTSMFTPIFALSRTVGWISQWKEMIADPEQKIGRPRQRYMGAPRRDYVEIEDR